MSHADDTVESCSVAITVREGAAAFHRVSAVLAHQGVDVRSMVVSRRQEGSAVDVAVELAPLPARALDQLLKRLRRQVVVESATAEGCVPGDD